MEAMTTTVLSVASRAIADACGRLGLDVDALLDEAGLDRSTLSDPDARIPTMAADRLWQQAYAMSRDPLLALHAAEALPFGAYRVLDFVAAHAPTIGEGLACIARYFPIVDSRVAVEVDRSSDPVVVRFESDPPGLELPPPAQEYTLAAVVLRSREGTGVDWAPARVDFTFPEPGDRHEHDRLLRGRVRFRQPRVALVVTRAVWDTRSRGGNEALHQVLDQHARILLERMPQQNEDFGERVRRSIAGQLRGGAPTAPVVARELGLGSKTLQRRLKAVGTSFAELLDEVRLEWARLYLADPGIALSEISWLLGFSEPSAFSRAFKRGTGRSPSEWRRVGTTEAFHP
jgi:AraC-like DNA-binding protein